MTLPHNVKDAVGNVDACRLETFDADWLTIKGHLMSQEAEIERLRGSNRRPHRRCQEAEASLPDYRKITALPPNGDGVRFVQGSMGRILLSVLCDVLAGERDVAQSRLAAANALLRECYEWLFESLSDGPRVSEGAIEKHYYTPLLEAFHARIQSHLQGAGDEA